MSMIRPEALDGILSVEELLVICPNCGEPPEHACWETIHDGDDILCSGCGRVLRLDPGAVAHLEDPHAGTASQAREQESRTARLYSGNVLSANSHVRHALKRTEASIPKVGDGLEILVALREADLLLRAAISFMRRGLYDEAGVPIPKGD